MKITIVFPKFPFTEVFPVIPPILEYLAALTMRHDDTIRIELFDANKHCPEPAALETDLVAISVITPTAPWAYQYADSCRRQGIPVVLGGVHVTALPVEAGSHADSVVLGEAEAVWGQVLEHAKAGSLQPVYQGRPVALDGLPMPVDSALKKNYRFRAFFTMRGCPYSCTFCGVSRFFGRKIRYRPAAEVAAEVAARAGRVWFNGDDNIWAGDSSRNLELFGLLAQGPRKHWFGFGDLKTVQDRQGEQLLKAARRSGLFSVMVGWESDSPDNLRDFRAGSKQGKDRFAAIKRIQDQGIYVVLFVVLGGRQDSLETFQRTLELSVKLNVGIHPILLMPLPGAEIFDTYSPAFIPGQDWSAFSGLKSVFFHQNPELTPERIEEEYHKLRLALTTPAAVLKRVAGISITGFPAVHLLTLMKELPMHRGMRRAYADWHGRRPKG